VLTVLNYLQGGMTALMLTSQLGETNTARALVEAGADLNVQHKEVSRGV
jgi:hypothetical protein